MNRYTPKKFRPANVFIILVLIVTMTAGYSAWTIGPLSGGAGQVCAADTYRDCEVTTPSSGCVLAYVKCNFISSPKDELLAKINAIRYEACAQGLIDPSNTSRRLTLSDYKPLKWSYTLEYMAQIRACEVALYRSHTRPSGKFSYGSMTYAGVTTLNEALAWKGGADIPTGINMWYGEKSSWVNGSWGGTSHYRAMINPKYTHVAFAGFPGSWNIISAEFTTASSLNENQVDSSGTIYQAIELKTGNITSFAVNSSLNLVNGKPTKPGMSGSVSYTNSMTIYPLASIGSSSSNSSVATADSKGYVTAKDCGTTDITFSFAGRSSTCKVTSYYSTIVPKEMIKRIYGHDRYDTAMEVAREYMKLAGKTSLSEVVVACGDQFPDALSGSTLSIKDGSPTLLVTKYPYVQDKVADFISSTVDAGGKIYILGGPNAVPEEFETRLADAGYDVERIAGADRYQTNLSILNKVEVDDTLLVCCGTDYPDAAASSATGEPVMLVYGKTLTDYQKDFLAEAGLEHIYIIGGEASVSPAIAEQLTQYAPGVARVWGPNRADTAAAIARQFFPSKVDAVTFAYGANFPDCISGGLFAHQAVAPILYGYPSSSYLDPAKAYIKASGAKGAYALGGDWFVTNCFVGHAFN